MIYTPEQHIVPVIPNPEQFKEWVDASVRQLKKRPSHFLLEEGVPGGKNRVSNFLKAPGNIRLELACELQRQILTDAVRAGVQLKPIEFLPLQSFLSR